jgi:hypothetical protein
MKSIKKNMILKIANWRYFIFSLLLILVTGCNSNADINHTGSSATKTGQVTPYKFALRLKQGARYYYSLTNETVTKLEVNDKKITTGNTATMGILYEVINVGADTTIVKLTYDKLHIVLKNDDGKEVIDADKSGEDASTMDGVMISIKGSSLTITLLKNGTIVKVDGIEEINSKVLSSLQYLDDNTKKQVSIQLSKMVGVDFVKNNIGQAVNFYPDSAISSGASWVRKSKQPGEINFDAITTYNLIDMEDGKAYIKSNSTINNSNASMDVAGQKVNAAIKGNSKGSYEADLATGMFTSSESNTSLDGTIQVLMKLIPVSITIKKELSIKPL